VSESNYIDAVSTLLFKTVTPDVWNAIQDEGLDEEQDAPNFVQWSMATLPISGEDSDRLRQFDDDTIEKFNSFDIALKEKFGGKIIDLIDYEAGVVHLVKTTNSKRASLFFISIPLGQCKAPITKVAISVPELVAQTNAFSVKRRPGCEASLLDSNPKQLFLHYNVKCRESYSDPSGHDVRVKFDVSKVQETQNANDLDVQLNCSCPAFLYWGAQWNLHQRDGLLGKPRPELVAPTQRLDLRGNFVICKHCKAVLERILPSVQHNIINIVREMEVRKNKEQLKQKETPDRLKKRQDEMKKRQELKKIRKLKNKEIQQKLLDALRQREEEESLGKIKHEEDKALAQEGQNPDVVGRDHPATLPAPATVETPKTEDITAEEPEGEEDLTALTEQEEEKLREEHHKKIKNQPHLHRGLPYETEDEKQEHGHNVPTDEELIQALESTRQRVDESTERAKKFVEDMRKRKQTSLEASLLASVAEGDND
jgi:hypothetical protein